MEVYRAAGDRGLLNFEREREPTESGLKQFYVAR